MSSNSCNGILACKKIKHGMVSEVPFRMIACYRAGFPTMATLRCADFKLSEFMAVLKLPKLGSLALEYIFEVD